MDSAGSHPTRRRNTHAGKIGGSPKPTGPSLRNRSPQHRNSEHLRHFSTVTARSPMPIEQSLKSHLAYALHTFAPPRLLSGGSKTSQIKRYKNRTDHASATGLARTP
jgi:hypothetical protein